MTAHGTADYTETDLYVLYRNSFLAILGQMVKPARPFWDPSSTHLLTSPTVSTINTSPQDTIRADRLQAIYTMV